MNEREHHRIDPREPFPYCDCGRIMRDGTCKVCPPEPPEPTESENREHRTAALRGLTNREILEAIGDSEDLASVLWLHIATNEAFELAVHPIDNEYLGERIREIVVPLLDRYLGVGE